MDWLSFKGYMAELTVDRDALHVYAAFAIQAAAALLMRRTLACLWPWWAVLVIESGNEALDLLLEKEPYIREWQVRGSIHDIVNTMLLPTLLMLLARYVPSLFVKPRPPNASITSDVPGQRKNVQRKSL
jgi:hypothetical protein